ncbi:MAG: TlpA disulfide reductase family protein [Crocinitomicaceae bacterium]
MKIVSLFLFWFCLVFAQSVSASNLPKSGSWLGVLTLNSSTELPFRIFLTTKKKEIQFEIRNGEEKIQLINKEIAGDTLVFAFPEFDSDLHFVVTSSKQLNGYWHNKNKSGRYTIPFKAHLCENVLFECQQTDFSTQTVNLTYKWKTIFEPGTTDAYPAIGLFKQNGNQLSGTFLTETGDYRFLDGNLFGNQFYLSCFDGSHAFLFTAELQNNTLNGNFYSGTHYQTTWIANPDNNYELTNPDELTTVVNTNPLQFSFKNLKNEVVSYPNSKYENKVTIIQIMGSWCPNCMDETHYYTQLYKKYHDQGLEIILVGYEAGNDENVYAEKLKRLQSRANIPFEMLIGGAANKNKAAKDFSMLNDIISFPTSIFVDRAGNISKVHTGFNGPSTGEYYDEYMLETEKYLQQLLKN